MARPAWRTSQESFPRVGNRELAITIDFTNQGTVFDDLTPEMQQSQLENIQTIYIDNSQNAAPFQITFSPSGQLIVAQAFTQGLYPVINWGTLTYKAVTAQGIKIPVIFSNTAKPYFVWGPIPGVTVVPPLTNVPINFQPLVVGDNTLIAGAANTTIKTYRALLAFGGGANVQFFDGPSVNAHSFTGIIPMFAGGSIYLQPTGIPWFTDTTAQPLVLKSDTAANMGGMIGYVQS